MNNTDSQFPKLLYCQFCKRTHWHMIGARVLAVAACATAARRAQDENKPGRTTATKKKDPQQ